MSQRQRLQRVGRTLRRGDGKKKPLIIILYVKGTTDASVTISADDPEFQGAADVHTTDGRRCLDAVVELVHGTRSATSVRGPGAPTVVAAPPPAVAS